MNNREILEDFVSNENTDYCYDWQGFNYEIILPCIEQLLKNENNLQSKIDKAIEFVEKENKICYSNKTTDDPQKVIGNFMWHTDKLLDILKEDK